MAILDEKIDVEDRRETAVLVELHPRTQAPRVTPASRAQDSVDAFHCYLQDIRELGLLTPDEESDLGRCIAAGNEQALRKLIESNVRLVIAIARKYSSADVPLMDLIQEGNLGLMHAAAKFDYRRGCQFGTYATWWIRQAISRAASDQARLIHLPDQVLTRLHKIRRVTAQLAQEHGCDPLDLLPEQIAEATNLNRDEVEDLLSIIEQPVSLDMPADDQARYLLADTLEDSTTPALAETASRHLLGEELQQALDVLTPRERAVIILRYGIGDGQNHTLLDIGTALGISRERVRQIEVKALQKLRAHYRRPSSCLNN
jgi:RNA polymerase primary sigma factor